MRTLTEKYLSGLSVDEDVYKVDLAVLDRYQSFSSELLRFSLLGIAGYGFLLSNIIFKVTKADGAFPLLSRLSNNKLWLAAGSVALAIAAGTALAHRYYSTDCITHYVKKIRLIKKRGDDLQSVDYEKLTVLLIMKRKAFTKI